jgi:hypothetical protein
MIIWFHGLIECDALEGRVEELLASTELTDPDFVVYFHGHGCRTRLFYWWLRLKPNVEVKWSGWSGPWWLYFLSFLPGQAGLVKMKSPLNWQEIYNRMSSLSMISIYFFPKSLEGNLVSTVRRNRTPFIRTRMFADCSEFLTVTVDYDFHGGERDGEVFYTRIEYGEKLRLGLQRLVESIGARVEKIEPGET